MFNKGQFNKQPFNHLSEETLSKIEELSKLPQNEEVPSEAVPLLNELVKETKKGNSKPKWTILDTRKLLEFIATLVKLSSATIELVQAILKIIFPQ